ncbi:MAG: hypothetical protein ACE5NM_04905 [Sedimentisphaerales bacterium]
MRSLSNQQKHLLFDYCVGLTSPEQAAEAEELIASSEEAAEFHSKLKSAFAPLECLEPEPCPDALAETTIWRVNNSTRSSQLYLQQLLAEQQKQEVHAKSWFRLNLGKIAAMAAVILIVAVAASWFVLLESVRQKSWRQQCQMQLSRIFESLSQYSSDHDGKLPAVAVTAGTPWWKVGYQGKENHSNTRSLWLLVKRNYREPADFVCPGACRGKALQFNALQVQSYNDFPGREYVTYSFQINCRSAASDKLVCRKVLMADLSPLFESLPDDYSKSFKLRLNKDLLTLNSINHKRRGQNVLFGDGRVEFVRTRHTSLSKDDIFTLSDTDIYQGCEVPSCTTDFFLAP